jgi:hypothetical protein
MTLDQKRATMALFKAILERDVRGAPVIMANASFNEHIAIAVCLQLERLNCQGLCRCGDGCALHAAGR